MVATGEVTGAGEVDSQLLKAATTQLVMMKIADLHCKHVSSVFDSNNAAFLHCCSNSSMFLPIQLQCVREAKYN
jgi:hypothetical protein